MGDLLHVFLPQENHAKKTKKTSFLSKWTKINSFRIKIKAIITKNAGYISSKEQNRIGNGGIFYGNISA
ncbi:MAG: hypothetical protein E7276_03910 [Pseudobutyrivibrio sp.]|nr:hypothetical protein [Pseudobutyrivibrio sp.]